MEPCTERPAGPAEDRDKHEHGSGRDEEREHQFAGRKCRRDHRSQADGADRAADPGTHNWSYNAGFPLRPARPCQPNDVTAVSEAAPRRERPAGAVSGPAWARPSHQLCHTEGHPLHQPFPNLLLYDL